MRFFTVPSGSDTHKSVVVAAGLIGYLFLIVCAIGLVAIPILAAYPAAWGDGNIGGKIQGGENMPITHLAHALGGNVLMLFLCTVSFATILTVMAGLALAGASAIARDLYVGVLAKGNAKEGIEIKVSRIATVVLGVAAVGLGIAFKDQNVGFLVSLAFGVAAYVRGQTGIGAAATSAH